jgi:hypothetical protein
MRVKQTKYGTVVQLSARDTQRWASRWPCSTLGGKRVSAQYDEKGDLVDLMVDGRANAATLDHIDGAELDAIMDDLAPEARKGVAA